MDYVNFFLSIKDFREDTGFIVRNRFYCNDGASVSIQASKYHYCSPREDDAQEYLEVEVGFPENFTDQDFLDLKDFGDFDSIVDLVYYNVPVDVVNKIIIRHGGVLVY